MKAKLALASLVTYFALAATAEARNVQSIGKNAANLGDKLVEWPLFLGAGVICVVAMIKREAGLAVGAFAVALVAGLFIIDPKAVEGLFKGVYRAIF
jgi:hypothetical protein